MLPVEATYPRCRSRNLKPRLTRLQNLHLEFADMKKAINKRFSLIKTTPKNEVIFRMWGESNKMKIAKNS